MPKRVLIVDDEENIRQMTRLMTLKGVEHEALEKPHERMLVDERAYFDH